MSADFKYANYLAIDFVDLVLRLISINLCYLGAKEKDYGLKKNFYTLQRQKKKLFKGVVVLLVILIV